MAYDYSSSNQRLELPNPYRLENLFLMLCAAVLLAAGLTALLWSRTALQDSGEGGLHRGLLPLLVGVGLLSGALGFGVVAARRLRFFFGRGRPASLAPEVAVGATGNSGAADQVKTLLRQSGLAYPEPQGALNGVLYHLLPRLITAPLVVQALTQKHFFNALAFAATALSFGAAWLLFGTAQARPLIGLLYGVFGAVVLLKPLLSGGQARLGTGALVALVVAAVVGPVLAGMLGRALPALQLAVHGQVFFMLGAALLAVALILLALLAQIDAAPSTERSCEQLTLSMNGPPGALITELDRRLQDQWVEQIPNRRYTRLEPVVEGAAGSGRFAGELFEETQPMPQGGSQAQTLGAALGTARHRWLLLLDVYGTLLVLAGAGLALAYVRSLQPGALLEGAVVQHAQLGYSAICLLVAMFCFQSASAIWGRFNFESVLVWVEMLGVWQSSRIGTGNQLSSQLQTSNEVVRVESMTLRVWRARIESVVFGKDGERQVTAMFGTATEARHLAAELQAFAAAQSVFIAPQAAEDQRRLAALKAVDSGLAAPGAAAPALGASALHAALQADAAHAREGGGSTLAGAPRFCSACGTGAAAGARFCSQCGQALA